MAVRPNTNGYLTRTTNLPVNATGWTWCARFMAAATPANYPSLFELDASADDWLDIDIPNGTLNLEIERQAPGLGFGYAVSSIFTLTTGVWYFLAIKCTGTGTADILHGPFGAETLTKISGLAIPNVTWGQVWHLNDRFGGNFSDGRSLALKMWHAALSDAEILAESKSAPPVRTSNIDSYCSLIDATDAGDDESGNNRDWTVTGTLATVDYVAAAVPLAPAVATAIAPVASAVQPVTVPLATATATPLAPSALAVQPVTVPLVAATATPLAPSALAVQPVTLPLATATATPLALIAEDNTQPVTVPLATAAAAPLAPSVVAVQPVTVPLATATAAPLALATGVVIQPVTLPMQAVQARPLQLLVGTDPSGIGRRSGRGRWRADRNDVA